MSSHLDTPPTTSPRRLRRLAKRAFRTRRYGEKALEDLAVASGVEAQQLRLLADAWTQGGPAGVDALGPADGALPDDLITELDAALEEWRRRHYPLETLQWEVWRNRVTVWQIVPGQSRTGPPDRVPVLQLRGVATGGWFLYRSTRADTWWPVVVSGGSQPVDLLRCLDTVRLDIARQFWSRPEPSRALPRRRA